MTRRSVVIGALVLGACTPRQEAPAPATSLPAPTAPAAPAPVAPAPPPAPQGAASSPAQVELPREPAPGSGSDGEPLEKRAGTCSADRDCRAFSHYCEGCFCVPLAKSSADLKCRGAHTACFVDPCRAQRAVCRKGACALVGEAEK